jgi:hypothetical protein
MPFDPSTRRRLVLVVSVGVVLVVLATVGIYGLTLGPPDAPPSSTADAADVDAAAGSHPETEPPAATAVPRGGDLPALPHTTDPVTYAQAVAEVLLAFDTMSALTPDDHARPVLDDADPAGRETPALAGDLANYLPTVEVWQQLRHHQTSQAVTIDAAYIPDTWEDITSSAGADHLRPGTVAVTIEATRHRAGVWQGEPATADHPIAFTVFLACQPAFERCHTLRLSRPDQPLP